MEILAIRYMFVVNKTVNNWTSSPYSYFLFSFKYEYSAVRKHEDTNIAQAEGVFLHILECSVSYALCSGRFSLESVISILLEGRWLVVRIGLSLGVGRNVSTSTGYLNPASSIRGRTDLFLLLLFLFRFLFVATCLFLSRFRLRLACNLREVQELHFL